MTEDMSYLDSKPTDTLLRYQRDLKEKVSNLKRDLNFKFNKLDYVERVLRSRKVITHYHNKNNPKRHEYD